MTVLLVALAGGVGAVLRHLVDVTVRSRTAGRWPLGLLLVNVTGSFALSLVVATIGDDAWRTVLGAGLLGGYTTFSSASVETARLALAGKGLRAVLVGAGQLVACVAAAAAGLALAG